MKGEGVENISGRSKNMPQGLRVGRHTASLKNAEGSERDALKWVG